VAVYTHLAAEDLAALIAEYDVGDLVSAKGIAEGISNSNWLVETTQARFILTMYERRIDTGDLPFFLGLLDHLSARGCAVPRTIHDRAGGGWREIDNKAVALIEYLPGVSVDRPTQAQAYAVGAALAEAHLAARDFPLRRVNALSPRETAASLTHCGREALARIDPALPVAIDHAQRVQADWPAGLPQSVCHTDLFPDNVLLLGDRVGGMIDFYVACDEAMAYDLAVTHAAWSFDKKGARFGQGVGSALVEGYDSVRPLEPAERAAMPLLAQGACLRFVASRAEDWLDTPPDALVTRKDPMDFLRRLQFYIEAGESPFRS
jgi:homoserine kinase type II